MKAVDTNVLVRFLVRDDKKQAEMVHKLFKQAETKNETLFVPLLVVLETIWVLESVYEISREEILDAFQELLLMPILSFETPSALQNTLSAAQKSKNILVLSPAIQTLDNLLDALAQAKSGDIIFIHPRAKIDCTERVYIEKLVLEIPAGVTLASNRGHNKSPGGMIFSDTFETRPLIRILGPDVRITGLRIRGPNPKPCLEHHRRSFVEGHGREYYYKFPTSDGIFTEHNRLEIDNCELAGWSHAAISLSNGKNHFIHHNFIHHNQYNGLGYDISHNTAESRISHNLFNTNRHSIAGTGRPQSGYEACHNIELGQSLSHCFDMHGGRDRKDGTTVAGTWMNIHHNTFLCPKTAVVIRGTPKQKADIHHNWFYQNPTELSVRTDGNTTIHDNVYGLTDPQYL